MKPLLFLLLLVFALLPGYGQDANTACCTKITADGRALYDAGEYALAKEKFELAKSACACSGMDAWIAKCDAAQRGPRTYTETVNGMSFTMIAIPGGTFSMGSDDGDADEKPVHSVTVNSFYTGQTEVTQALWRAMMGTDPSFFKNCDQCPVEEVSWEDAQAFIQKLNQRTGKNYRLPTEAEWEYAAGGGNGSRTIYAGTNSGSSLDSYAWYSDNSGGKTHPVKSKSTNALDLYDMSGNVHEWCQDWYKGYPGSSGVSDLTGSSRVCRGGSWLDGAADVRVANRNFFNPGYQSAYLGFRLARAGE